MKKIALFLTVVFFVFGAVVFAENFGEMKEHVKSDRMEHGKMGNECMHCAMMKKTMMSREIIATQDGGIVVALGNKLMKYDKNLNLVKEAEIKMDMQSMRDSMMKMKENCPMCGNRQNN